MEPVTIVATRVRARDLKPGDLFDPNHSPEYYSPFPNFLSVGIGVWIRTAYPPSTPPYIPDDGDIWVTRLEIVKTPE